MFGDVLAIILGTGKVQQEKVQYAKSGTGEECKSKTLQKNKTKKQIKMEIVQSGESAI